MFWTKLCEVAQYYFLTYIKYHDLFDGTKFLALLAKVVSDVIQDSGILLVI